MDIKTKMQRSYNMSRIGSKNTKPELLLFSLLKTNKIKFKKHFHIYGKPDIAFPKQKVALFVNGEFWHGKDYKKIKSALSAFWVKKIGDNIKRDKANMIKLRAVGWHIINFWGRNVVRNPENALMRIIKFLEKHNA